MPKLRSKQNGQGAVDFCLKLPMGSEHIPSLLEEIASNQGFSWNDVSGRACSEVPEETNALEEFLYHSKKLSNVSFSTFGKFKSIALANYPIMPANLDTARKWHHAWLMKRLSASFTSEAAALVLQKRYLSHPAMDTFSLSSLQGNDLYQALDRAKTPLAYWHVMSMRDLLPTRKQTHLSPITLTEDTFDIEELICHLTRNEPVRLCLYSDRHYKTKKHSRNLDEIQKNLNAEKGLVLSTAQDDPRVPARWELKKIEKSNENHDRYWVFQSDSRYFYWKCSTSLDFFTFKDNRCLLSESNPTFTPLDENEIPDFLIKTIHTMESKAA